MGKLFKISIFNILNCQKRDMTAEIGLAGQHDQLRSKVVLSPDTFYRAVPCTYVLSQVSHMLNAIQ